MTFTYLAIMTHHHRLRKFMTKMAGRGDFFSAAPRGADVLDFGLWILDVGRFGMLDNGF